MKRTLALAAVIALAGAAPKATISIDVRDAPLASVITMLAGESGRSVVADQSVRTERISLHLERVDFRQALDAIAAAGGLTIARRDGILFVGTPAALGREQGEYAPASSVIPLHHAIAADVAKALIAILPAGSVVVPDERTNSVVLSLDAATLARAQTLIASLDADVTESPRVRSIAYRLRYTRASDVAKELKALLTDGAFVADDRGNAIVVTGDDAAQDAASHAIAGIDVAGPQVLFEVRVADVTPASDSSDVGLEFGGLDLTGQPLSGATTYAFAGTSVALNVRLNALVTSGRAQILATPRLVTLNGQEADLLIGETYPVVYNTSVLGGSNVQFVDIGVKLRLTPVIGSDGTVTAELHPEYSELQGFTSSGYPIIANRKIDSTLRVRSGQTIVLGGLLRDTSSETIERVPWLSQIPVVGKIFEDRQTSHERDEIVFLITPHIVDETNPPSH
ncbi:MAG: secretin N-terminal domain-containing protein [Candidatus Tyrphobacter sp.]